MPPPIIRLDPLAFAIVFPPVAGVIEYEVVNLREVVGLVMGYMVAQLALDLSVRTTLDFILVVE